MEGLPLKAKSRHISLLWAARFLRYHPLYEFNSRQAENFGCCREEPPRTAALRPIPNVSTTAALRIRPISQGFAALVGSTARVDHAADGADCRALALLAMDRRDDSLARASLVTEANFDPECSERVRWRPSSAAWPAMTNFWYCGSRF
jgi:hypothetical protein